MDDSDDEIWEYKSLTKKHKTDEKASLPITRQNEKLKSATKSKFAKREKAIRGYTQHNTENESSQCIDKKYRFSARIRTSNNPSELTVNYQDAPFPISVDSDSQSANLTDNFGLPEGSENFCPICQVPFTLLRTLSSSSHVIRCLEESSLPTDECIAGLTCDSKEEMHYKQFKHSALAMARSGQDFTDFSGNKSREVRAEIPDTDSGDKWRNKRLKMKNCTSDSVNRLNIQHSPMLSVDSQLSLITTQWTEETRPSQEHIRMSQRSARQSNTAKKETLPISDADILELDEMRDVSDMLNDALEDEEQLNRGNNSCGLFNLKCNVNDNILVKSDDEDENFLFDDDDDFDVMITQTIAPKCQSSENLSSSQSAQWKAIFKSQGEIKSGSQSASQKTLNSSQKDLSKKELPSSQNSQSKKTPEKESSQVLKAKKTARKQKVKNAKTKKTKSQAALMSLEKGRSKNGKSDCRNSLDDKQTVLTSFFSSKTGKNDIKKMKEDSCDDIQVFTDCSSDSSHRSLQKEQSTNCTNNNNTNIKENFSETSKTKFLKSSSDSFAVRKSLVTGVESLVESIDCDKYEGDGFIPELICDESNLTSPILIDNPTRVLKTPTLCKPDFSVTVPFLNSMTHSVCIDQPVLRRNASEILMASSKRVSTVKKSADDAGKSLRGKWNRNQSSTVNPPEESEQNYQKYPQKCPFYKKIPDTSFTVDAFKYGVIPGCTAYFLSHFHYDHYMGLTKKFSQPMYCSQVTANLVQSRIHVDPKFIHSLPLNTASVIEGTEVTLLEANHCPGSVLLLFKLRSGQAILHTGDFRADPSMELYPVLQNYKIRTLYLDTTYCDPTYTFPAQQEVIDFAVNLVVNARSENPKTLIVCGAYTIGKERVFTAISEALNCKICVTREKKNTLDCLEEPRLKSRLSLKWSDSGLHVLPMAKLRGQSLEEHLTQYASTYNAVLALEPTGWTFSKRVISLENIKPKYNKNGIKIYGVPYSEHSSFLELKRFVQFLKPETIIPTVNNGNPHSRKKMEIIFDSWREEMTRGLEQRKGSNARESKQTNLSAWI
ncbi:hypothetical protein CHS0354_006482 [Potamilus streckersoni]|uniref:DNA cross-link repair 1A protein n=1 Tax=Potamilus streckersoni TaxID=2493646 RepID=A0AAE0TA58_9BIVA|nr:hypothetical protein CHS0354_006482 [Potamilus streckersoni]